MIWILSAIFGFIALAFFDDSMSTAVALAMICLLLGYQIFSLIEHFSDRISEVFGRLDDLQSSFDRIDRF